LPLGDLYPSGTNQKTSTMPVIQGNGFNSYTYGWTISILPQMEQQPLYNAWNFAFSYADASGGVLTNSTVSYNQLATLLCPSENAANRPQPPYGALNYVGNWGGPGSIKTFSGTIITPYWGSGSAPLTNAIGLQAITDGTSNTAMFSERLFGITNNATAVLSDKQNAKRAQWTLASGPAINSNDVAGANNMVAACKGTALTWASSYRSGQIWIIAHPWAPVFNRYTHYGTPNGNTCEPMPCTFTCGLGGGQGIVPPTSNHSGGVNVCFTDGSVKFIKDSISPQTWWALGTRDWGETISADAF